MTINKLLKTLLSTSKSAPLDASPLVLGQLGIGCFESLFLLSQSGRLYSKRPVQLHIFVKDPAQVSQFIPQTAASLPQSQTHSDDYAEFIELFRQQGLTPITGCQRLIFAANRLTVDFHLGDYQMQCKNIAHSPKRFKHWLIEDNASLEAIDEPLLWQVARLSDDEASIALSNNICASQKDSVCLLIQRLGFSLDPNKAATLDEINQLERQALRFTAKVQQAPFPNAGSSGPKIAVIGGGVACSQLALSLAERGQHFQVFCKDTTFAQQASGNKQGAFYPLLTPENGHLSQFFQQAYLFSRRRLVQLVNDGFDIAHQFCGVLHTGHDERSYKRVKKIIDGQEWAEDIAFEVDAKKASQIAGISVDKPGIFYPLGGWVSPKDFTLAAFAKAQMLSQVKMRFNCTIDNLEYTNKQWYLYSGNEKLGPFDTVVLANGQGLNTFSQTSALQLTGFRGQVSHIPTRPALSKLNTVLCSLGYFTPGHQNMHCLGASYIKGTDSLAYSSNEQLENLHKMQHSYQEADWVDDIDITGHSARVGVRMVTRDHAPMMGCVPDVEQILSQYQQHQLTPKSREYWRTTPAPFHQGLYLLGGLGSRGISSGPLAAEALAAQICGEVSPISLDTMKLLSPNRMWMRKLLKGKAL